MSLAYSVGCAANNKPIRGCIRELVPVAQTSTIAKISGSILRFAFARRCIAGRRRQGDFDLFAGHWQSIALEPIVVRFPQPLEELLAHRAANLGECWVVG